MTLPVRPPMVCGAAGYGHPLYAQSLAQFGSPCPLPLSGGTLLKRRVPGRTPEFDAMGCYPLFVCYRWDSLYDDLQSLGNELVCLSLVADPFAGCDTDSLAACFPDLIRPFKDHFVIDLSRPLSSFVTSHHRRNAVKAGRALEIEKMTQPSELLDDWVRLYDNLIMRHAIRGMATFSRDSFKCQLEVPGIAVFRAVHRNETVGALIFYLDRGNAYYHLGAYSPLGYELKASFALFAAAIEDLASHADWLDLGSGAGANTPTDGLVRFKQGWSTGQRTTYLCGRIFNRVAYAELAGNSADTSYFPAYRKGEFS